MGLDSSLNAVWRFCSRLTRIQRRTPLHSQSSQPCENLTTNTSARGPRFGAPNNGSSATRLTPSLPLFVTGNRKDLCMTLHASNVCDQSDPVRDTQHNIHERVNI